MARAENFKGGRGDASLIGRSILEARLLPLQGSIEHLVKNRFAPSTNIIKSLTFSLTGLVQELVHVG
jgi:hypothetical protein